MSTILYPVKGVRNERLYTLDWIKGNGAMFVLVKRKNANDLSNHERKANYCSEVQYVPDFNQTSNLVKDPLDILSIYTTGVLGYSENEYYISAVVVLGAATSEQ